MRNLLSDSKGDSSSSFVITQKSYFYVLLILFIGILLIIFITLLLKKNGLELSIEDSIKADFTFARLTNNCFAYTDPVTGEVKQNVIDIVKVSDSQLGSCFISKEKNTFEVVVKPIFEGDFPTKVAKLGNPVNSDLVFVRYVLVADIDTKLKPAEIYLRP